MQITCPICGIELELPDNLSEGRHLQCSECNIKFVIHAGIATPLAQSFTNRHSVNYKASAGRQLSLRQIQRIDVTSDKTTQSRDAVLSIRKLFLLAPASIKFIAIYTICLVALDLVACAAFGDKPSSIGIILFISIFPLLKRKEKAWRWLAIICYLSFAASAVMIVCAFTLDNIDGILPGISSKVEFIVTGILSALVNLPIFIALRRSTARQWACK